MLSYFYDQFLIFYNYLLNKYYMYIAWKDIIQQDNPSKLSHLQLATRAIKHVENIPITTGETFMDTAHGICGSILNTTDLEQIKKECPYVPGTVYEQDPDGIHVKIEGDEHVSIIMSSLSYWAFHVNKEVMNYAIEQTRNTGVGNHGSYLVTGRNTVVERAYKSLARFFNRDYCSISASGFLACMNLIDFLANKESVIFMDERAHVCLSYGARVAGAKKIKFKHNDFSVLETLIKKHRYKYSGTALLVLDAIYSAEGTLADLPRARELCDKYDILLVMDEAHSLGSIGETGHGIEEYYNMYGSCDYICGVFSKSLSSYGGFVVSNHKHILDLNVSPGVGFATGLHAFSAATVSKGIEIIERDGKKVRKEMEKLRKYFVVCLKDIGCCNIKDIGHDIFVSFPNTIAAVALSIDMRKRGYLISAFMYPSVPLKMSLLRLTVNPLITQEMIEDFCCTLEESLSHLTNTRFNKGIMYGEMC